MPIRILSINLIKPFNPCSHMRFNNFLLPFLCCLASSYGCKKQTGEIKKRNIIFIICDDLRPELGCYGHSKIKTPNIDRWAKQSVVFERAYCNIAVSGASRASLLTGYRPTKNTLSKWDARADVDVADAITLQQHLRNNGYKTIANGKVYHHQDEESMQYWDEIMPPTPSTPMRYLSEENIALMEIQRETGKGKRGLFYEYGNFPEEDYLDWQIATKTIKDLKDLNNQSQPFFLSVGFILPHLPFVVPEEYWNLYNHADIEIPENYILKDGNNIPSYALANWSELRAYSGIPDEGALTEETAKLMIHGYYAAVSFLDTQIGRVLNALNELGLDKNTSVVVIGDHGWNLGEHGTWCKHSIMNTSLNTPLIINSPEASKAYKSNEIVEFVDLYPTICDLAGIPTPKETEGESLFPLLISDKNKSKGYAVCRWANGFTYIKDSYFYTEWRNNSDSLTNCMLFDHKVDPEENNNIASNPDHSNLIEELNKELNAKKGANFYK